MWSKTESKNIGKPLAGARSSLPAKAALAVVRLVKLKVERMYLHWRLRCDFQMLLGYLWISSLFW